MIEIHPIDLLVGRKVRQARQEKAMSQEQLGDHLEITFQQIQKYERGINRVSASRLYDIAEFLEKPVNWFFETEAVEIIADKDFVRFYGMYLKIRHLPQTKIIIRLMLSLVKDGENA